MRTSRNRFITLTLVLAAFFGFPMDRDAMDASKIAPAGPQEETPYATREYQMPEMILMDEESSTAGIDQAVTLSIDDGTFEQLVGLTQPGTISFINRLQPSSYPATLSQVQIYFAGGPSNLSNGAPFTLLVGSNPNGGENINGIPYQQSNANIQSLNQWNTYNVPNVTINSGDFLVGFRMQIAANVHPGAEDTNPPSHRRSYLSTDGFNYTLTEDTPTILPGDFGIRAVANLQPASTLSVSPTSLTFNTAVNQGNPPSQTFTVTHQGSGFLSFNISSSDPGLVTATPSSGTLSGGQSQTITVFVTNPNQIGSRQAFLTVSAPGAQGSPQTVNVTVNTSGPASVLGVSPTNLTFNAVVNQGNPPSQQFTVSNFGSGSLNYSISSSDFALVSVSPASGTVGGGQSHTINVFVNNPNQVGTRQAFLTVTAPGAQNSPRTVNITVNTTSPPAILNVSPTSLTFNAVVNQGNPPSQQFTVTNSGSGFMSFSITSSDSGLVNATPASGTLSGGQSATITVFVNNPNQAGTRQAFLTVTASGAQNSPRTVNITVNTTSPPAILNVSPTSLTFSTAVNQGNPPSQQITVTNFGSGFMSFNVSSNDPSLVNVSPASGSVSAGQSQSIIVFVNNPNQAGTRQAQLTVSAPGAQSSPQTVNVTVNTTGNPPILSVAPASLAFSAVIGQGNPPAQSLTVQNTGGSSLTFNITTSNALFTASPLSGTLSAGQSTTVQVSAANPNTLGTATAQLTVSAAGALNSPQIVSLALTTDAGGCQDEGELNDSPSSPKVISLVSQSITLCGDVRVGDGGMVVNQISAECQTGATVQDWFRVDVLQRDAISVTLTPQGGEADFHLYIFIQASDLSKFSQGVQLMSVINLPSGQPRTIPSQVFEPGVYYIAVSRTARNNFSDATRVDYTLAINRGASPELHAIEDASCAGFAIGSQQYNGQFVVNRVRPTRYPARLESINILFAAVPGFASPNGRPVRIIAFADPGGSGVPPFNPSLLVNQTASVTVPASGEGQFNSLSLGANGPVINQGDFYVGFVVDTNNGILLNAGRVLNPGIRSFLSANGGQSYQQLNLQDPSLGLLNVAIRPSINTRPFGAAPEGDSETLRQELDTVVLPRPRILLLDPKR